MKFEPVNVTGLDTRVWQAAGSSNDAEGVVFTLRGEVAKVRGIQKLVEWSDTDSAFSTSGAWGLHQLHHHGSTEIIVSYEDKIAVLQGNELASIFTGRSAGRSPRTGQRSCQSGDMVMFFDGISENVRWDGHIAAPLGVRSPPASPQPILIDSAGSSSLFSNLSIKHGSVDVTYSYVMSYENERGQEGPASVIGSVSDEDAAAGARYNIAVVSDSDPKQENIVARLFYRSTDSITYKLVRRLNGVKGWGWMDYTEPNEAPSLVLLPATGENAAPPVSRGAFLFRGRVYFWGMAETPSFLQYSSLNAPESAPTQNVVDVTSSDGDVITGWAVAQDFALVFKRHSVFLLSHDRDEQPVLSPVANGIGAVSDLAIVQFDGKVYFLSDNGFFVTDGSSITPISRELDEWVRLLPPAHFPDAFGWADTYGRRIMLSVNAGGSDHNNEVWAIHVDTGAVTRLTGFTLGAAISYKRETIVVFRSISGGTQKWELGLWNADDNIRDTSYTGRWETRWLDMKTPSADKRFTHIILYYVQDGNYDLTVDWATSWDERENVGTATVRLTDPRDDDGNMSATLWGEGLWDSTRKWDGPRTRSVRVDLAPTDGDFSTLGKSIRFGFQTTGLNTPFHIVGFEVLYEDHGTRQDGTDATF